MNDFEAVLQEMQGKHAYRVVSNQGRLGIAQNDCQIFYEHCFTKHLSNSESLILCKNPFSVDWVDYSMPLLLVNKSCLKPIKSINHIPFYHLRVNDKVVSAIGKEGFISDLSDKMDGRYLGNIVIKWSDKSKSEGPYALSDVPWLTKIEYIGR